MAEITKVNVQLITATESEANVGGWVYVSIAGREFSLDADHNDFEPGDNFTYTFGEGSNVLYADRNDPRFPALDTDDLDRYPVYLRYEPPGSEPNESWCLERVIVTVNPGGEFTARYDNLRLAGSAANQKIWLGQRYGKAVNLRRV
ncbi:hypothetical protein AMK26_23705 [Streptomyces sp. CB03234]|uniref:hypothetical protein n=1 Tax=Streptomyces sp. (strain CB03234) TaxID=1703937 RepID=UPI00093E9ACF|nr:hypothetical protein [Streptomyces sp. CB03234]OKK02618.1 hypothetical protein AMK26_23705 [Streptomyces sp. CB03234]